VDNKFLTRKLSDKVEHKLRLEINATCFVYYTCCGQVRK